MVETLEDKIKFRFYKTMMWTMGLICAIGIPYSLFDISRSGGLKRALEYNDTFLNSPEYEEAYRKLFGPFGLAQKDNSPGINFDEKADAWYRMGFTNKIYMHGRDNWDNLFPRPTLLDLEKAIKSYESERSAITNLITPQ